jgi:hypothetical protein
MRNRITCSDIAHLLLAAPTPGGQAVMVLHDQTMSTSRARLGEFATNIELRKNHSHVIFAQVLTSLPRASTPDAIAESNPHGDT